MLPRSIRIWIRSQSTKSELHDGSSMSNCIVITPSGILENISRKVTVDVSQAIQCRLSLVQVYSHDTNLEEVPDNSVRKAQLKTN